MLDEQYAIFDERNKTLIILTIYLLIKTYICDRSVALNVLYVGSSDRTAGKAHTSLYLLEFVTSHEPVSEMEDAIVLTIINGTFGDPSIKI